MEELKVFENQEFGKVRVVEINNESFLVGKDVVEALGYDLSGKHVASEYIKKYCDEEDYVLLDKNSPLNQGAVIDYKKLGQRGGYLINESGLYALTFGSELPNAKKFKHWVTSEVLPTIRKTGGYVNNDDLFINTYLPFADDTTKMLFKGTLETVRKQNELIQQQKETIVKQENEIYHKEDVIIGLTQNINLAEKRQRITQIIRHNSKKYQERYNLLYSEFEKVYHCDISRRLENGKERGEIKKSVNKMEYICSDKYMNMTNELYEICCKLFESDFVQLLDEWKETVSK